MVPRLWDAVHVTLFRMGLVLCSLMPIMAPKLWNVVGVTLFRTVIHLLF